MYNNYDYGLLGDYEEDFLLVCRTIDDTIKEFAGNQVGSVEIKEVDGKVEFDHDAFMATCHNIHTVRERSETLKALYFDGFKLMAEEAAENGQLQGVNEEGEETVSDI